MVLIAGFPAGSWAANCYVVATGPGSECVVVDPGQDAAPGIADIVREHIDGATTYELLAAAEGWPETDWLKPWRPPSTAWSAQVSAGASG